MRQIRSFEGMDSALSGCSCQSAAPYMHQDFDQDELSGRYGNSRDRQVVQKFREARSKPRMSGAYFNRRNGRGE